jgi:hypothetical protein
MRGIITKSLKRSGHAKKSHSRDLLGCDWDFLRKFLESKFLAGMSWENHGDWHIDHIRPISWFDLSDSEQLKAAFHYANLQPLWKIDNLKKGNRYEG